ncbi:MAG: hypothetical protein R3E95_18265 [Thiolinea sp.]
MHNRYVEPHKQRVDFIISGEIAFEETLPDLVQMIRNQLESPQFAQTFC